MDKYVKADRVKERCAESCKYVRVGNVEYLSVGDVCRIVDEISSDDVIEVVKCKDCKYFNKTTGFCTRKTIPKYAVGDDFCSYGERRK